MVKKIKVTCPRCRGTGEVRIDDRKVRCPRCGGSKMIWKK